MRSVLVAGIVFVGGCSLLVPLDASSGGGGDDAADATAEGASSSSGNTTSSSGGSSGTATEAGPDSAGPVFVCPNNALLCDDFERGDLGSANGWSVTGLAISTERAYSPTRSVAIFDPTNDYRAIERIFQSPPLYVACRSGST